MWTCLADSLSAVVADTSMLTITPEYAAHIYYLYTNKKENAKFTGDSIKMLMQILPFLIHDLIATRISPVLPLQNAIVSLSQHEHSGTSYGIYATDTMIPSS